MMTDDEITAELERLDLQVEYTEELLRELGLQLRDLLRAEGTARFEAAPITLRRTIALRVLARYRP
jgi:hypothetical protein